MNVLEFSASISLFHEHLDYTEKSHNTKSKYLVSLNHFLAYVRTLEKIDELSKENIIGYKEYLFARYRPKTVNLYIVGINQYLKFLGAPNLCFKSLNIEKHNSLDNCITNDEYNRMLDYAKKDTNKAVYYVMRTLACTGMRIRGLDPLPYLKRYARSF